MLASLMNHLIQPIDTGTCPLPCDVYIGLFHRALGIGQVPTLVFRLRYILHDPAAGIHPELAVARSLGLM